MEIPRDHPEITAVSADKLTRARQWLTENGYDNLIITKRENFFWLTTGGDPVVVRSTESGIACILVTQNKQFLVSHSMDAARLMEEQLPGLGYEAVEIKWYEGSPVEHAMSISRGKTAADAPLPGAKNLSKEISRMHIPLYDIEIERLRWLGNAMNEIYLEMAGVLKQGMTEIEAAAEFLYRQSIRGISSDVLIAGSDERVFQFRHPMPTEKKINHYVMLHSAARRWGLHAPVTRAFHYGQLSKKVEKGFQAVARVQSATFQNTMPGVAYREILDIQKNWYEKTGFPGEWRNHFQGGPTGYFIVDATLCLGKERIRPGTAFEWFITVPGAKIAELTLLSENGLEILSAADKKWPSIKIEMDRSVLEIPGIYIID